MFIYLNIQNCDRVARKPLCVNENVIRGREIAVFGFSFLELYMFVVKNMKSIF